MVRPVSSFSLSSTAMAVDMLTFAGLAGGPLQELPE
jgi:hypothetical protein